MSVSYLCRSWQLAALILSLPVTATPQTSQASQSKSDAPPTKIESLLLSKGTMLAKDFYPLGKIPGSMGGGSADVSALVVSRLGGTPIKGLRVEVKDGGRLERTNTSFLDGDEVDDLLKAIDYFNSAEGLLQPTALADGSATPHREITFTTKGGFSVTCFGQAGARNCAIQSGTVGSTSIFINGEQLLQFRTLVDRARPLVR